MFWKSKEAKEREKLKNLGTQIQFYEYLCSYIIMAGGTAPISLYIMIDYTSIKIMELLDVPKDQVEFLRLLYKGDHDKMITQISKGEVLDSSNLNEKIKTQQEELKKLGINFNLTLPNMEEPPKVADKLSKPTSSTQLPNLTKDQIKKIIADNYDEVLDLYLKKKKEEEKKKEKLNGDKGRDV
jgi:hypothetical protein